MSASREKKRRQQVVATNGGLDPKAAREAERLAAEKKSQIMYTTIAAVFVAVSIFLVVFNSGIVQRNRAALTVDGEKYTVSDVNYYYYTAYQNFMQSGYGSYFINTAQPLGSQQCVFDAEKTWADYFKDEAINNMKLVHAAAKAASFRLRVQRGCHDGHSRDGCHHHSAFTALLRVLHLAEHQLAGQKKSVQQGHPASLGGSTQFRIHADGQARCRVRRT